jgi:hypothetical protein
LRRHAVARVNVALRVANGFSPGSISCTLVALPPKTEQKKEEQRRSVQSNERLVSSSKSVSTVFDAVAVRKKIGVLGRYIAIGAKREAFIAWNSAPN